jgi:hypothetical protein
MKKVQFLTLAILVSALFKLTGQVTVQGIVRDSTNTPIPFVTVTAAFAHQKTIAAFTFTTENGEYKLTIPKLKSDTLIVSASSIGFKKLEIPLVLESSKLNYILDFQLITEKFNLPTLTIKADKPNKIVKKDTTTFKVKYYIDSTERVLEDVLKKLPGMNVKEDGSIEYKGKPIERILVEGDDLFNTNNKIPSKNLHASLIEDVQVIDRYSSNPLMRNIENSERQILNLTFKKDRKKALFGSINAGGGFENRYDGNTNLISFLGKMKLFALGGVNNVGSDLGNGGINSDKNFNRFNNPDYYDPSVEAAILIPTPRLSAPNLPERRININQTQLASVNFLTRPTENWTLKMIGLFSKDRISQQQNNLTQYFLGNNQFSVKEIAQATLKPSVENFHLENKIPLSKNANLTLVNEYKNENASAFSTININDKNIVQELNGRSALWRNLMSVTMRLSDSTAVVIEGAYIRDNRPQNLTLIPKENYVSLINQPQLDFTSLNQNAQVATEYGGFVARLVKAWRTAHKFNLSLGGSFRKDGAFSAIFTDKNGEKQLFNDSSYINRVNYRTQDFFTSAGYNLEVGDVNIGGKLTLVQRHNQLADDIERAHNFDKNWLYATPRFTLKWKWNSQNSINGTYSYKARFADLDDVLGNYIFRDYRHLNRNSVLPYRINGHAFSGLYRFDNSNKKLEGHLIFMYMKDGNARNNRYSFTPFFILTESVNQQRDNQSYIVSSQIMKFFPSLNLSVKVETNHNIYSSYNSIGNSNFEKNTNATHRYLTQFVSTYDGVFNFITGTAFSFSKQWAKTNGQEVNPVFSQQQVWLKTKWRFNKKLFFTINNEYTNFKSTFGKNNNRIFTDITGQYEIKPSKIFLYLDLYNIFNVREYTFTSLNINQIAVQSYALLPRMLVLKGEWRF